MSSKCDFKFSFKDIYFFGTVIDQGHYDWMNIASNLKFKVQSSKCDWAISGKGENAQTSLSYTPEFTDIAGRFKNYRGRISSDKCDFNINAVNSLAKVRVSSDKCDWSIATRSNFATTQTAVSPDMLDMRTSFSNISSTISSDKCDFMVSAKRPTGRARVSSSKCDWNIAINEQLTKAQAQVTPDSFGLRGNSIKVGSFVSSSKCDWNIVSRDKFNSVSAVGNPENLAVNANLPGFSGRVSSSKCDFQISALNQTRLVSNVNTQTIGTKVAVASSKCDWKIQTIGGDVTFTQRPQLNANLASSKCDFVFNIELGLSGGKFIHIRAVSSDKCDFRLDRTTTTNPPIKTKQK